jgi:hypothetical protein
MNRRILLPVTIALSGALIALSGYAVATFTAPAPAAVAVQAATPAPAVQIAAPPPMKADAVGYLIALRAAGVPPVVAGGSEVGIARYVCGQLATGATRGVEISDVNAIYAPLTGVDGYYDAVAVVDAASTYYC